MENKKIYKSTKEYSEKYNKININVQLNRELIDKIKDKIKEQNISLKEYIEKLLKNKL
jgi:predicted DNA binding CopG/RHH family protein